VSRPAEALAEYEASLKVAPKRRHALAGPGGLEQDSRPDRSLDPMAAVRLE
jgi:hypothetical protein